MKKILSIILCAFIMLNCFVIGASASGDEGDLNDFVDDFENAVDTNSLEISAKSAVLMDAETGMVLYSKNATEALAPASVTKIMTLLLVAEAISDGNISLSDSVFTLKS